MVIGDSVNFKGPEELLHSNGIEVVHLDTEECISLTQHLFDKEPKKGISKIS